MSLVALGVPGCIPPTIFVQGYWCIIHLAVSRQVISTSRSVKAITIGLAPSGSYRPSWSRLVITSTEPCGIILSSVMVPCDVYLSARGYYGAKHYLGSWHRPQSSCFFSILDWTASKTYLGSIVNSPPSGPEDMIYTQFPTRIGTMCTGLPQVSQALSYVPNNTYIIVVMLCRGAMYLPSSSSPRPPKQNQRIEHKKNQDTTILSLSYKHIRILIHTRNPNHYF